MSSGEAGAQDRVDVSPNKGGADRLALQLVEAPFEPSSGEESAEDLLRLCADLRNTQAWERLLRRFNPLIVVTVARVIRKYVSDRAGLVDDLVQDVYVKLSANHARTLREFEPWYPGAAFGYLKTIAANVAHDYFKLRANKLLDQAALPEHLAAEDATEWRTLLRDIEDVLRKAPVADRDRHIFWLYYRHGMSAKEIAAIGSLNLKVKGVESVIVRLNQIIRNAFENGGRQSGRAVVS